MNDERLVGRMFYQERKRERKERERERKEREDDKLAQSEMN